ncbi:Uncharacterised protein [Serratia quinivorans]|nr:Uncharacterised protein [Serratia quinivorans]
MDFKCIAITHVSGTCWGKGKGIFTRIDGSVRCSNFVPSPWQWTFVFQIFKFGIVLVAYSASVQRIEF